MSNERAGSNRKIAIHWISSSNLKQLKVKRHGYIAGGIYIHYIVTEDGEIYFIQLKK